MNRPPDFTDASVWEPIGEFGLDFYEKQKGKEDSSDWGV